MTGARLNDPAQIAWGDRWGLGEASLFATLNLVLQVMLLVYFEPQLRGLSLSSPSHWERFAFAGFSGFLLACAAVVSLCLWLLLRWSWLRALLQVPVQAAFLLFLFSDLRLYASTGLHLLDRAVLNTLANQDADRQLHLMESSSWSLLLLGTALVVLELFLLLAVRALGRRRSLRLFKLGFPTASAALLVLSLALLRLSSPLAAHGYLDGLPFFSSLLREQAAPPRLLELVYPTPPSELTASARPSILFILVESWRADALSAEKMPRLHAISSGPSCIRSAHHYAGGHTTEYGAFSLLYALNGYHYVPFREQARGSFPLALLRAAGYGLYGMSASSLKEWNHSGFITENFDHYEEHLESAELADEVLGSQELGEQLPRFDLLFFNATHHNYLYPPEYEIHTPVIAPDYDHYLGDLELRNQETGIRNRYLNALRFVDDKLSNILEREWSRVSTGELVVVITGDHGEEFWEHGLLGHGAPRFSEQRCAVPLLVCGTRLKPPSLSAHVDIFPNILSEIGILPENWLDVSRWSDGELWRTARRRAVHLGGLDFPWTHDGMALVFGERKLWLRRCAGDGPCLEAIGLTDLDDQAVPLAGSSDDWEKHLDAWRDGFGRFLRVDWKGP